MLAILDYGAGNLASVNRALQHLGVSAKITANPETIAEASAVIFPGVGHAGQAMDKLRAAGLDKTMRQIMERRQPLLGICLGCQILLDRSAEGPTETLGLAPGDCVRFENDLRENGEKINIPHIGWNSIVRKRESPLFEGVSEDAEFYFVHSYYARPASDLVVATTVYGREFCSVYGRNNFWAVQFHPEKSGEAGLKILKNFCDWSDHAL